MSPLSLGSFEIGALLGRGGMGEVYRAVHSPTGQPVAVKVLTSGRARAAHYVEAFHREVRAVARLSHPGVVRVLDYGAMPADGAGVGSPYLVMELGDGTLDDAVGRASWASLRPVLLALLDALAHVHARGVVHLDLKPSNVLTVGTRVKLSDFGIARMGEGQEGDPASGTPAYMPPEHLAAAWREVGPWTDLWALGALTWAMITGAPPFPGGVRSGLAPLGPAPPGLEGWLVALLDPEPGRRFRRAADAERALREIPPWEGQFSPRGGRRAPVATLTADGWVPDGAVPQRPSRVWFARPPFPPDWRRPAGRDASPLLVGAGLGLYGLREVPLVGREAERDTLWAALGAVEAEGRSRAVILRGDAGVGKSGLATWLARRAHEVGAATVLTAVHGDPPGPQDGVLAMLGRAAGTTGLPRPRVAAQLARVLALDDPREVGTYTQLLAPRGREEGTAGVLDVPLATAEARTEATLRLLGRLADRPLVVVLDDVQWGRDTLRFARELLEHGPLALVVLTVREGAVGEEAEGLLGGLGATELRLAVLDGGERRALIGDLLGLAREVAGVVEERTAGNPLFAVQLVGDWVQRGILVASAGGFVLREGADTSIPDAIHGLWVRRVDELLADRPGDRVALEVAATLGTVVDKQEWADACREAGVALPDGLVEAMRLRGLAVDREHGAWVFRHGMLAESVARLAAEAGRSGDLRRAAGRALSDRGAGEWRTGGDPRAFDRLTRSVAFLHDVWPDRAYARGRLVMAAVERGPGVEETELADELAESRTRGDRAVEGYVLFAMSQCVLPGGRYLQARDLLLPALEAVTEAGDRETEVRVRGALGRVLLSLGPMEAALGFFETALALDEALGGTEHRGGLRYNTAVAFRALGRVEEARANFELSLPVLRAQGHLRGEAAAQLGLGNLLAAQGRMAEARACFEIARGRARDTGDRNVEGLALVALGTVRLEEGAATAADECYSSALAAFRECGATRFVPIALGCLANARRDLGRVDEALALYEESITRHRQMGRRLEGIPLTERAVLLHRLGRFDEARQDLLLAEELLRRVQDREQVAVTLARLARLELDEGHADAARLRADEALALADEIGAGPETGVRRDLAEILPLLRAVAPESPAVRDSPAVAPRPP